MSKREEHEMERYELATLTTTFGAAANVAPAIAAYAAAPDSRGRLLGCWASDLGGLNQIAVLRGFATEADLAAERHRTLMSSNPFNSTEWLTALSLDSYAPFPFLPPVETGSFGPVYEIRSYILRTGGLGPTIEAWRAAVPARVQLSRLVIAMYALDGAPRFTHIWSFPSLNDRAAIRAEAVTRGIWPPKGGPDWLTPDMRSTIYLPTAVSPLR